jgi:hypothetical protein
MIKFAVILTFALRIVVGNAWHIPAHEYANNGVRGYLIIAGAANGGGESYSNNESLKSDFYSKILPFVLATK